VCQSGDGWTVFPSYLSTGRMEDLDVDVRAPILELLKSVSRVEALRAHGIMSVAMCSDSQAAIRWTAHLDPWPGQHRARVNSEHARALHTHSIEATIHWVPGHSGIPGNPEPHCHANTARENRGYTVPERIYTLAGSRERGMTEGRTAAKATW